MRITLLLLLLLISLNTYAHNEVDSLLEKGRCYYDKEQYDSASSVSRYLINKYPYFDEGILLYVNTGIRFLHTEAYQKATAIFKDIITKYPNHVSSDIAYFSLGEIAYLSNDTPTAIHILTNYVTNKYKPKILVSYSNNKYNDSDNKYYAYCMLSKCLITEGKYLQALQYQNIIDTILRLGCMSDLCGTVYSIEEGLANSNYFEIYKGLGKIDKAISYLLYNYFIRNVNYQESSNLYVRQYYDPIIKKVYNALLQFYDSAYIKEQAINAEKSITLIPIDNGKIYTVSINLFGTEQYMLYINAYGAYSPTFYDDMSKVCISKNELEHQVKQYYTNTRFYKLFTKGVLD